MRYIHRCKEVTRACYESEVQERQIIAEILQGLIFSKQTNITKVAKINLIKNHIKFDMQER